MDKAKLDIQASDFKSMNADQQSQVSFLSMLQNARAVHLHTDDFEQLRNSKATGGMASDVMKLNVSGDSVRGLQEGERATHYFNFADEYDTSEKEFSGRVVVDNILKRFPYHFTQNEKEIIRERAKEMTQKGDEKKLNIEGLSQEGVQVLFAINKLMSGASVTYNSVLSELKLTGTGKKVNVSCRNVATSRVAELLGVGNLVAKSESVVITDNYGNSFTGNLMQSAKGGKSAAADAAESKIGEGSNEMSKGSKNGGYQIKTAVSGGFQRDLCNLQILDCVCGQIDRHRGNYLVTQNDDGEMTGLQGIDNDAAFGLNEDNLMADSERSTRSVVNKETGLMQLPFVDADLASRIESIDASALEYILKDLLSAEEIKATVIRFNKIKQAIKNTKKTDPDRFLKKAIGTMIPPRK